MASRIDHPNIVQVLDFGITDGDCPFMVMEHVDGRALAELIEERGRLSLQAWAKETCSYPAPMCGQEVSASNALDVFPYALDLAAHFLEFPPIVLVGFAGLALIGSYVFSGDCPGAPGR